MEAKQKVIVYHNTRCSKSRCALEALTEKNIPFEVVEYLKNTPSREELTAIIQRLGIRPEELVRKGELLYKELFRGKTLTDEQWIDAMLTYPILIERPIIVNGNNAIIGRPTERIFEIL
jgi:arsenate reductase